MYSEAQARQRGLSQAEFGKGRIDLADGRLTAYEVTGLDLDGTELVNMTACETGLGEVKPDGVVGLRLAFLLAGPVVDDEYVGSASPRNAEQIRVFYDGWLGGKGKKGTTRYKAFHAAQLDALQRARQIYDGAGHPFYWAGVVFVGDPGDLPAVTR